MLSPPLGSKTAILFLDAMSTINKTGTENSTSTESYTISENFIQIFQNGSENFTLRNHVYPLLCKEFPGIGQNTLSVILNLRMEFFKSRLHLIQTEEEPSIFTFFPVFQFDS